MNTIITIKAFHRPYYLNRLLESLANAGVGDRKIMLSIDRYKNYNDMLAVVKTSALCKQIDLITHDKRQWCAGNMRVCFDYAFRNNTYDNMIHLEEDVIVAGDYFRWMDWSLEYMQGKDNVFTSCPSRRKCKGGSGNDLNGNLLKDSFECQGGFGINRKQWEYIESLGGIFGCIGPITSDPPMEWKKKMRITDDGSWAWPFECYFRKYKDKLCLCPDVGRSNNVGAKEGRFNISEEWHKDCIYDVNWIGADKYNGVDLNNITYNEPVINKG